MKIIQTFWSGEIEPASPFKIQAGWLSPEYNWMSWALSCLLLTRHYDRVELYTDEIGKKILIDILQLPYTDVHIIFDGSFNIHPKLFALAKIKTYSLQEEPFIHIDGDLFLWRPFPDSLLNAELISSNLEVNLFFNKEILEEMEQHFQTIPKHLKGVCHHENIFSSNAGIIGGSNISFIKHYCKEAFGLIESNAEKLELVKTGVLNCLIEQVSLFYLSKQEGVKIKYYIQKPVDHPLYQDHWRFADVPDVEMIHPVAGCKKELYVLDHLTERLRLEFPEFYYKILRLCKKESSVLRSKLYTFLDLDNIKDKKDLQIPARFLEMLDPKISEMNKVDFERLFERTLLTIEHYFSQSIGNLVELSSFVQKKGIPLQIKEVYDLEMQRKKLLQNLIKQIKKGKIYNTERLHYKKTANFFLEPNWIKKQVAHKKKIKVLDLGRNWDFQIEKNKTVKLNEIFTVKTDSHLVTLNYNLLNLEIQETYHNGIDALVMKCVKKPKTILQLLVEIREFFEDDFSVDNPEYQRLVFDTIKRLSFANLLAIH